MPAFWLYRVGISHIEGVAPGRHWCFGETIISFQAPTSEAETQAGVRVFTGWQQDPFGHYYGGDSRFVFESTAWIAQELIPNPHYHYISWQTSVPGLSYFNAHAPEACLRLQRVGVDGTIGRLMIPIVDDSVFTDRPHRRTVDGAYWSSLLVYGMDSIPQQWTYSGRTYYRVIWHRKTKTYSFVDHHRVLDSVARIWKRWKPYPYVRYHTGDARWFPYQEGSSL